MRAALTPALAPPRPPRVLVLVLVLVLPLLSSCASAPAAPSLDVTLSRGALPPSPPFDSPPGVVFVIHGIWPDGRWVEEAVRALEESGVAAVPVDYTTFLLGYWTGLGTDPPTERIEAAARALSLAHARTGCPATLRFHAIGHSGGATITLKAAQRGVRFGAAYMSGSPIPAASFELEDLVRAGRIGRVVNICSPVDGVVGPIFGMGQWGWLGAGAEEGLAIADRWDVYHHLFPPYDAALAGDIARELRAEARERGDLPHACFADAPFRTRFEEVRDALARAELPPPAPATGPMPRPAAPPPPAPAPPTGAGLARTPSSS